MQQIKSIHYGIRRLEGFNLIPSEKGGDNFLIQGAMIKLEDAGIYAATKQEKRT